MSAQPEHDAFEAPFWKVLGVWDPHGQGPDFSYTVGLHERGLPELHVWAQPDRGEDPGADWKLSARDRGHLLNELADLALHGRLGVGTELERTYDAGQSTLRLQVGPPADPDVVEALQIAPDALVLPVHWSLHRAPEGPRSALSAHDEEAATAAYGEITAGLDAARPAPPGWSLPATPSFAPEQRYGPLTPVVLARAAQLWQADEETTADVLRAALLVEAAGISLSTPVAVAGALARPVGRSSCLADLAADRDHLVGWLTEGAESRARWHRVVGILDSEGGAAAGPAERDDIADSCVGVLADVVRLCLSVEVVADVADVDLLLWGRGPWLSGLHGGAVVPGDAWVAAPEILRVVADLLAPLEVEALGFVAGLHEVARTHGLREAPGYAELCGRLSGWAVVSAAGCPWDQTLASLPGSQGVVPEEWVAPLQQWATCVASALTHRWQLSHEEVHTLAAPFREVVPRLEEVLNRPV